MVMVYVCSPRFATGLLLPVTNRRNLTGTVIEILRGPYASGCFVTSEHRMGRQLTIAKTVVPLMGTEGRFPPPPPPQETDISKSRRRLAVYEFTYYVAGGTLICALLRWASMWPRSAVAKPGN